MSVFPENGDSKSHTKPYFLPESLNFEALRPAVQLAFMSLVEPLYQQLVLGAADELERSAASSFVMDAVLEIDAQIEVGAVLNLTGTATQEERDVRDRLVDRLHRIVRSKQRSATFLHTLRAYREKGESAGT